MGNTGLFDLEKHFAFYGAYHSNPVNVFIHMLFVWPNFFTTLVLFHFTPHFLTFPKTGFFDHSLALNLGFLYALIHASFYVCFDKRAGSLAALLCFSCWVLATSFADYLGFSLAWKVVLATQLFCYNIQFLGHNVFEKRAPAHMDNLPQAFLMAPFFVVLEGLRMFFGYESYPGFYARVKPRVEAEIKEWRDSEEKKVN